MIIKSITNAVIDLRPDSQIRIDALNTLKYTFWLDYSVPEYTDDDNFVQNVLKECDRCCYEVLGDNDIENFGFSSCRFFGYNVFNFFYNDSDNMKSANGAFKNEISKNPNQIFADTIRHYNDDIPFSFSDTFLQNFILQHCVIMAYHAIKTELNFSTSPISYSDILKDEHSIFKNNSNNLNNPKKIFNSSNFKKSSDKLCCLLPFLRYLSPMDIYLSPEYSPLHKEIFINKIFSDFWYKICGIHKSRFKNIFLDDVSKANPKNVCENIFKISSELSIYNIDNSRIFMFSDTKPSVIAESIHYSYLVERIFNFRAFYNILSSVYTINRYTFCRLDDVKMINSLSSIIDMPNALNRQLFLNYAIHNIGVGKNNFYDFGHTYNLFNAEHSVSVDDKITSDFDLNYWGKQFSLFTEVISQYAIPIYEWCFMCMLLDSVEKKYPSKSHKEHLRELKKRLENFMGQNYDTFLRPYKPDEKYRLEYYMIDNVAPFNDKLDFLDDISEIFLKELIKIFFSKYKVFNLNLSQSLKPQIFKSASSTKKQKNFYISFMQHHKQSPEPFTMY